MSNVAANVAANKERHPELYCPTHRCLWRTGGGTCPRHTPLTEAQIEMIREDRLCRAEAIGRSIRPNYKGD